MIFTKSVKIDLISKHFGTSFERSTALQVQGRRHVVTKQNAGTLSQASAL